MNVGGTEGTRGTGVQMPARRGSRTVWFWPTGRMSGMRSGLVIALCLWMVIWLPRSVHAEGPISVEVVGLIPRNSESVRSMYVGVRFTIAPGWHLYWKNPGDFGLPTKVAWELPVGFSAESLQWPRPSRFSAPGQPKMYGYEGEVVLVSRVIPPPEYRWGDPVDVTARTSWLGCSPTSCVRASKELREQLSSDRSQPLSFFENWDRRVPLPADRHPVVRAVTRSGAGGLGISWREVVSEVEVLPEVAPAPGVGEGRIVTELSDSGAAMTTVTITPRGAPESDSSPVIILFRRADGSSDAVAVSVPPRSEVAGQ